MLIGRVFLTGDAEPLQEGIYVFNGIFSYGSLGALLNLLLAFSFFFFVLARPLIGWISSTIGVKERREWWHQNSEQGSGT